MLISDVSITLGTNMFPLSSYYHILVDDVEVLFTWYATSSWFRQMEAVKWRNQNQHSTLQLCNAVLFSYYYEQMVTKMAMQNGNKIVMNHWMKRWTGILISCIRALFSFNRKTMLI